MLGTSLSFQCYADLVILNKGRYVFNWGVGGGWAGVF